MGALRRRGRPATLPPIGAAPLRDTMAPMFAGIEQFSPKREPRAATGATSPMRSMAALGPPAAAVSPVKLKRAELESYTPTKLIVRPPAPLLAPASPARLAPSRPRRQPTSEPARPPLRRRGERELASGSTIIVTRTRLGGVLPSARARVQGNFIAFRESLEDELPRYRAPTALGAEVRRARACSSRPRASG